MQDIFVQYALRYIKTGEVFPEYPFWCQGTIGNDYIPYIYTSDNISSWKRSTVSYIIINVKYKNKSLSTDGYLAKRCDLEMLIWNMYDMHSQRY